MLELLVSYCIIAVFAACTAVFLYYCIGSPSRIGNHFVYKKGRIFSRYGSFLTRKATELQHNEKKLQVLKPLGLCFICFATWISLVTFAIFLTLINVTVSNVVLMYFAVPFSIILSIFINSFIE